MNDDTIAAIATPSGQGGVGIIRVSGPKATELAQKIAGLSPSPRYAHYGVFSDRDKNTIDSGLTIYFKKPVGGQALSLVPLTIHLTILKFLVDRGLTSSST